MTTLTALQLPIGFDWDIAVTAADSAGVPIDLTSFTIGGQFYQAYNATPVPLTGADGAVSVTDAAHGKLTVSVNRVQTAKATDQGQSKSYPTKVVLSSTSANGRLKLLGTILIAPVTP